MADNIEVPRKLIENEDWGAIKKLINHGCDYGSLFGRWATHEKYGRVMCLAGRQRDDTVYVAYRDLGKPGRTSFWVPVEELTFDPLTLTTVEDFENAPVGTIVEREGSSGWIYTVTKMPNGKWTQSGVSGVVDPSVFFESPTV